MDNINSRINRIEERRKKYLFRLRAISMSILIITFIVNVLQGLNDFYGYIKQGKTPLAIFVIFTGIVGILFEYFVRWKVPMIEGVSEHLIELRKHIALLYEIRNRFTMMKNQPDFIQTFSTECEMKELSIKILEYENRISFDESLNIVIAHNSTSPRHID